jgi:hypothetical protein
VLPAQVLQVLQVLQRRRLLLLLLLLLGEHVHESIKSFN